jgi:hypothetical protein
MENVNFQCGSCGQLMAVAPSVLGQQVRCPHCQQVVLAPPTASLRVEPGGSPAGGLPAEPQLSIPNVSEVESIFTSPESNSDALFGGPPRGLVEMPPDPLPQPTMAPPLAQPPPVGPMDTTMSFAPPDPGPAGVDVPTDPDPAAFALGPGMASGEPASAAVDDDVLARAIPKPKIRPPKDKGGWIIALLIVPLISYSILATIAVIYLRFFQAPSTNQPHPLEMFPDLEGENPGVRPGKKGKVSLRFHDQLQEKDLPAHLRTTLGKAIQVGDVEVTPLSVEFRKIQFLTPGYKPQPSETACCLLNLLVKNLSANSAFHPLDPYFERRWAEVKGTSKAGMPFTYLTIGNQRYYGGPIRTEEREDRHDTIQGQNLERELQPGESFRTFVCTSPDDAVKEAVERTKQPMLWRVQVRRGLVQTPHRGEVAACAVVGIEFTRDQIQEGKPGLD